MTDQWRKAATAFMDADVALDEACNREAAASAALDVARTALKAARDRFYEAERDLSEASQAVARSGEF